MSSEPRVGDNSDDKEVLIKATVWLYLLVGNETCWIRLDAPRVERNWDVNGSEWSSTWMLKSPARLNLRDVVTATERKKTNS